MIPYFSCGPQRSRTVNFYLDHAIFTELVFKKKSQGESNWCDLTDESTKGDEGRSGALLNPEKRSS